MFAGARETAGMHPDVKLRVYRSYLRLLNDTNARGSYGTRQCPLKNGFKDGQEMVERTVLSLQGTRRGRKATRRLSQISRAGRQYASARIGYWGSEYSSEIAALCRLACESAGTERLGDFCMKVRIIRNTAVDSWSRRHISRITDERDLSYVEPFTGRRKPSRILYQRKITEIYPVLSLNYLVELAEKFSGSARGFRKAVKKILHCGKIDKDMMGVIEKYCPAKGSC